MINYLTTKIGCWLQYLHLFFHFLLREQKQKKMERLFRKAGTSVLRVECLSVSLLSQVSDMTRRTSVGLLAYMVAIVSTPFSRQSYLPSTEK